MVFFFKVKSKHLDHTTILASWFQYSRAPKKKKKKCWPWVLLERTGNVAMCLLHQGTPDFSMERPLSLQCLGFFSPQLMWISLAFRNSLRPTHVETTNGKVFSLWQLCILKHFYLLYVSFSVCVADECVLMFGAGTESQAASFVVCFWGRVSH